ncbi:adenylyl-sulfate kinase [Photorhabdus temperata]|uniref:adenylyl-sulfate kinase n=1 Tax=Photorhabdus temperata TaxID=574560 RepID=UPI0021D4FD71|nr:adenylyl-sulfate kinase [Photorhabdus temperata]MCT8347316.1 adenylyl-sulfate kinase [Photorhabdus temperata]
MAEGIENLASENVVWHRYQLTRERREAENGHPALVIWFTGLSGSGKSTVAGALEQALFQRGIKTYLLDGDNLRHGLCSDLGFSEQDRQENIRRVGEVANLMVDAGLVVLTAFISPHKAERQKVRELLEPRQFIEVFVDTPLEICESRDPKGLYKKARAGEIRHFTGIGSAYEIPDNPEIYLSGQQPIEASVEQLLAELKKNGIIRSGINDL